MIFFLTKEHLSFMLGFWKLSPVAGLNHLYHPAPPVLEDTATTGAVCPDTMPVWKPAQWPCETCETWAHWWSWVWCCPTFWVPWIFITFCIILLGLKEDLELDGWAPLNYLWLSLASRVWICSSTSRWLRSFPFWWLKSLPVSCFTCTSCTQKDWIPQMAVQSRSPTSPMSHHCPVEEAWAPATLSHWSCRIWTLGPCATKMPWAEKIRLPSMWAPTGCKWGFNMI